MGFSPKIDIHLLMVTGNSLSTTLEHEGFRSVGVHTFLATSFSEMKKHLNTHHIDVVLIDWEYGYMDPFEIVSFVRSQEKQTHVPIIVSSVHSCDDRIKQIKDIDLFVKQPIPRVLLLEKMRRLLNKKTREKERIPMDEFYLGSVKVTADHEHLEMMLADISMSGIFLYSTTSLENGRHVSLEFVLPGIKHPIKIEGEVVRVTRMHKINDKMNKGIGIRFMNMSSDMETILGGFFKEYKPDSDFIRYYL